MTGYTSNLTKTTTLKEFALRCVSAFFYHGDVPAESDSGMTGYYQEEVARARRSLAEARAMSTRELDIMILDEKKRQRQERKESKKERATARKVYNRLYGLVNEWNPPTTEHLPLRKFMLQQLRETREHDCDSIDAMYDRMDLEVVRAPVVSLEEQLAERVKDAEKDLARAEECLAKEEASVARIATYLKALRESLG